VRLPPQRRFEANRCAAAALRPRYPRRVTTSLRTTYRSQRLFLQKSLLTHSVAAPFQIANAALVCDLVFRVRHL